MAVPAEPPKPKKEASEEEVEQPVEVQADGETPDETSEEQPEAVEATADGDFKNLTPREKALVQKARVQEKQKLYEDIKGLKKRLKAFEDEQKTKDREEQIRPKATKSETASDDDDLRQMIRDLRTEITEKERRNDLRNYRRDKIAEVRAGGERIIEALVMGESEEDIDASIEVAKAEAAYIYTEAERELRRNGNITTDGRRTVVMRESPRRPGGVPPTVSSGPGSGDEEGTTISMRDLLKLASMDSVRDGTYAANRKKIHEALIEGRIRP
jgi:hypothetical protein